MITNGSGGLLCCLCWASCFLLFRTRPPDQLCHSFRELGAARLPKRHAIELDAKTFFAFSRARVVKAHALDKLAIAAIT